MRGIAFALAALLLAGCAGEQAEPQGAAAWTFTATDGTTHAQAGEANATVLFFMATWCGSCQQKAPLLSAAHDEQAGRGVRFLSLDFDPSETAEDLAGWQERYAQPWPHGIDEGLRIQRAYGVTTQSTVLVLDADGSVVERFGYGAMDPAALRAAIDDALAQAA